MRRGVTFVVVGVIATATAFFACSSSFSSPDGAKDGGGEPSDSGTPDVTVSSDSGSAQTDSATSDAADATPAMTMDAGVDACAHTFCETFDDGRFASRWTISQAGDPTLTLFDGGSVSPPYSLAAEFPVHAAAGAKRFAYLSRSFPGAASLVVIEADVRIDSTWTAGSATVLSLLLQPAAATTTYYELGFNTYSGGGDAYEYVEFTDGGNFSFDNQFSGLQKGQWTHVRYALSLKTNPSLTFYENGVSVATKAINPPTFVSFQVALGTEYVSDPGGPMSLLFDNVTIDVTF
jgi:hypothetical protein